MSFLFLLISFFQTPQFKSGEYIPLAYKNGFSVITQDSLYLWEEEKGWSSQKLIHQNFNLNDKVGFYSMDRTFVVSAGIGLLYELRNDSLIRLDNSFDWRSRYNTKLSSYNNQIYSFGGYGLWTMKNNLVYWDELSREWMLEDYANLENVPKNFSKGISHTRDSLFFYMDSFFLSNNELPDKFVYQYNYKNKSWSIKGKGNDILYNFNRRNTFELENLFIHNSEGELFELNFTENSLLSYVNPAKAILKDTRFIVGNPHVSKVMLFTENGINKLDLPFVLDKSTLTGNVFIKSKIYDSDEFNLIYLVFLFLFLITTLFIGYKIKKRNPVELIKRRIKLINPALSLEERKLLQVLLNTHPKMIKLPDLIVDFEKELTFDSKVKKFRKAMQHIEEVVIEKTILKPKIFIYSKNKEDKRIKEIGIRSKM